MKYRSPAQVALASALLLACASACTTEPEVEHRRVPSSSRPIRISASELLGAQHFDTYKWSRQLNSGPWLDAGNEAYIDVPAFSSGIHEIKVEATDDWANYSARMIITVTQ